MLELIIQRLQIFLDGVLGKDRKTRQKLTLRLSEERADYDRLLKTKTRLEGNYQKVTAERDRLKLKCDRLIQQYHPLQADHIQLQQTHKQLEASYAALKGQQATVQAQSAKVSAENEALVAEKAVLCLETENLRNNNNGLAEMASSEADKLNSQIEHLKSELHASKGEAAVLRSKLTHRSHEYSQEHNADKLDANDSKTAINDIDLEALEEIDLSPFSIALVGGHGNLLHNVSGRLRGEHNVRKKAVRILGQGHPSDHNRVKEKIKNCDFVFIITASISHKLNDSVMALKHHSSLKGEVIRLDTKGTTSVLTAILTHICDRMPALKQA